MPAPWNMRLQRELDRQDAEREERSRTKLVNRLVLDDGMTPERAREYADTLAGMLGKHRKVNGN